MSRFPIGFMAAFGLALGAYCVSQSNAEERGSKSSAPAKDSSAATAPATQEKPADTGSPAADEPAAGSRGRFASGMGVGEKVRSLGNRQPAQPTVPSEPLAVLKSGPDHTRLVYRLKWTPATNTSQTVSQLLRQEGELHGTAGTAAKGGPALRVAIAADSVTNCLVISGPPDAVEEVRQLAEKMDGRPPMVQFEMEMGKRPSATRSTARPWRVTVRRTARREAQRLPHPGAAEDDEDHRPRPSAHLGQSTGVCPFGAAGTAGHRCQQ